MLKKTLLATATAGLIAAGAMVGATSTASAASLYFGGPNFSVGIGNGPYGHPPMRECRPIFRTVHWVDYSGKPHHRKVVVGRDCGFSSGPGPWHGPNPGWGYHPY